MLNFSIIAHVVPKLSVVVKKIAVAGFPSFVQKKKKNSFLILHFKTTQKHTGKKTAISVTRIQFKL